ncbi:MAG: 3-deoxy-D-manno-octulosonic acid transferase [Candidatus Omnitrophota bacterium]
MTRRTRAPEKQMLVIYDLLYLIAIVLYLPVFLLRRKFHRGMLSRLGIIPADFILERPIWIHAVSLGEAVLIKGLLRELRLAFPNKRFIISTVTPTGNKIAKGVADKGDFVTYLPLDLSFIINNFIKRVNPSLFIVAETEIWPNLLNSLHKRRIPIIAVNARISDNSFKGYYGIKFLIKPILNKVSLFCTQSEHDARRLAHLGVEKSRLCVTGNMKFDLKPQELKFKPSGLRLKFEEQLWVCGSTHPGEEEIILAVYKELLEDFSDLRLLLAPRHPERSSEVASLAQSLGFKAIKTSSGEQPGEDLKVVYILDSVGELLSFYSIAHIVFVGGSLVKKGGHNILEPAALGKPIIFGAQMFNFRDIAQLFLKNKAALQVHNQEELKNKVRLLLSDPSAIQQLGQAAKDLIKNNQGATQRNLDCILSFAKDI